MSEIFNRDKAGKEDDVWDDSALIDFYDRCKAETEEKIAMKKTGSTSSKAGTSKTKQRSWKVDDECMAPFEDGRWYPAKVLEITDSTARVIYTEYDEEGDVPIADLLRTQRAWFMDASSSEEELNETEKQKFTNISLDDFKYSIDFTAKTASALKRRKLDNGCGKVTMFEKKRKNSLKRPIKAEIMALSTSTYSHARFRTKKYLTPPNLVNEATLLRVGQLRFKASKARYRSHEAAIVNAKRLTGPRLFNKTENLFNISAQKTYFPGATPSFNVYETVHNTFLAEIHRGITEFHGDISSESEVSRVEEASSAAPSEFSETPAPSAPKPAPSSAPMKPMKNKIFPIPNICPPPPALFAKLTKSQTEKDALTNMLMSWYMSGYHTGYFEGFREAQNQSTNTHTRK